MIERLNPEVDPSKGKRELAEVQSCSGDINADQLLSVAAKRHDVRSLFGLKAPEGEEFTTAGGTAGTVAGAGNWKVISSRSSTK